MAKKRAQKDKESDSEGENEEETVENEGTNQPAAKKGWNYAAIVIMLMFILPGFIAVVLQGIDMMYPEAKAERIVRDRVTRCYEAANPSKVHEVDKIVKKYKGRDRALFAQLRNKYEKYPECN